MSFQIAIDGPSATGKSTLAKALAKELSFIYIDTGAMYRAVGLYNIRKNIDLNNEADVVNTLKDISIDIKYIDKEQRIFLNGEDVSNQIREEKVGTAASIVSTYKKVREVLVDLQRSLANVQNVIMDGRDIGTVVLPNASLKIFLTASSEERTKRRYLELKEKGKDVSIEDVAKELKERDERDTKRANSPLTKAEDAILVDTTNMNIEQTIEYIKKLYEKRK
mgnify:FL=1